MSVFGDRKNDGGPAFPCAADEKSGWAAEYGMTLRAWLTGQALAGLLANNDQEGLNTWHSSDVARMAVECADAVIKELDE